jgi:hypothetical protein
MIVPYALLAVLLLSGAAVNDDSPAPLERSVEELRHARGAWAVTTEFLNEDGSIARTAQGSYEFEWVIEDRVLQGSTAMPTMDLRSAILFYIREADQVIEMVSVGQDGKLWIMTGPLGGDTRYSQTFKTRDGGEAQLRFTRFNAGPDRFESRMEYSEDGGSSWKPGNHQVF